MEMDMQEPGEMCCCCEEEHDLAKTEKPLQKILKKKLPAISQRISIC